MKYIFLIIILVSLSADANAQIYTDTLSENSPGYLVQKAVNNNSKLEYYDIQRRIELIKKEQVNKQPMPMLEAMIDYIPLDFMAKPEYGIFYSQRLILPSKISVMEETSGANAVKQDILKRQVQIELKRQVYSDYFDIYYYQRLLGFNLDYQGIMKDLVKNIQAAYVSGMGTQTQIIK
ncbi:MAG TPA: TolC family protein, partial [Ignavibacteria bacterium]|nr:TolC family protein [Ignavibacteria bacterium]